MKEPKIKKQNMKNRGITLIALVVTIVVLLILAAVSISMLTGENGIITQAKEAKEESIIGREKESIALAFSNCKGENLSLGNNEIVTDSQLQEEMTKNGENVNVTMKIEDLLIEFIETKNKYIVNQNGNIEKQPNLVIEEAEKIIDVVGNYNNNVWVLTTEGKVKLCTGMELENFNELHLEENAEVITEKGLLKKGDNWFVDSEGKVYTWGINDSGQLGNGNDNNSNVPICISNQEENVLKGKRITRVSSSRDTLIALDSEGNVYTWGNNVYGQLGDGTELECRKVPICISDIEGNVLKGRIITEVYIEEATVIALDNEGKVYTWGSNDSGQLGNGNNNNSNFPICISDIEGNIIKGRIITEVYIENSAVIALDNEGKVYTWGSNYNGKLGEGTTTNNNVPICISNIEGNVLKGRIITEVYIENSTVIALDNEGKVYTWGSNGSGQLGNGITEDGYFYNYCSIPICISDLEGNALKGKTIVQICLNLGTVVALDNEGKVYTWGDNVYGQLGDGTELGYRNVPICISNQEENVLKGKTIEDLYNINIGDRITVIVLDNEGKVYVWGANKYGQLGDGTKNDSNFPICLNNIETHKLYNKKIIKCYAPYFYITNDGKLYYYQFIEEPG